MHIRLYRSILFPLILLFAGPPLSAQTVTAANGFKIAPQSAWVAGLPVGSVIAWGDGTNFSNAVTTTAAPYPPAGFEASAAQFTLPSGYAGPGALYVAEGAAAVGPLNVTPLSQPTASITVPALPPPPPPVVAAAPVTSTSIASALQILMQYLQSSTPGVENLVQITCGLVPATLPPGLVLPLYGSYPVYCVFAPIQQNTAPIVPPVTTPAASQ